MAEQMDDSTVLPLRCIPRPCLSVVASVPSATPETERRPEEIDRAANVASLGGIYTAPFGFVLNALINGAQRSVPLVIDDENELGAVSHALELVNGDGGFEARAVCSRRVEVRIRMSGTPDAAATAANIRALEPELLELFSAVLPDELDLPQPPTLELLPPAQDALLVSLLVEAPSNEKNENLESAMHGAARAILPALSRLSGVEPSVRIVCTTSRRIQVSCRIDVERLIRAALATTDFGNAVRSTEHALYRATAALGAGSRDGAVAAAHNGMIASGIAAVAFALGNAPGRVIADAERYAARDGGCRPLCSWRAVGDAVQGELELPLVITTHGRWSAPPPPPRESLIVLSPELDIGMLAACIGMASSVVALQDALRVRVQEERGRLPPSRPVRQQASANVD
jgi:hydroxymethylglutaryl-CoA reductase